MDTLTAMMIMLMQVSQYDIAGLHIYHCYSLAPIVTIAGY